jgi:hypothetical protein
MNEFAMDDLARRLVALEPRIDSADLIRRVLVRAPRRGATRRSRLLVRAGIVAALLLVSTAALASFYAPVFAEAVADAPIAGGVTGWMLRTVGLAGVPHRVTAMSDTSSSSGYEVELAGGYADSGRTVLFLRASPPARVIVAARPAGEMSLTDQFGQRYRITGAVMNAATGENTVIFEPLRWPAMVVGARLQLTFAQLEVGVPPASTVVAGRWRLSGTLAIEEGRDLPHPAEGAIGQLRVSFDRVRATSSALRVDLTFQPGDLDLARVVPDGQKGRDAFTVTLVDGAGRERTMLQGGYSSSGQGTVRGSWMWLLEVPGPYELRISYEGAGALTRRIDVP